jgi:hypothetical protein
VSGYNYKNDVAMAYDRNKKRLRFEGRLILDELLNEALNEMTGAFNEAAANGQILELEGTRDEMLGYLRQAAQKQLGSGS